MIDRLPSPEMVSEFYAKQRQQKMHADMKKMYSEFDFVRVRVLDALRRRGIDIAITEKEAKSETGRIRRNCGGN